MMKQREEASMVLSIQTICQTSTCGRPSRGQLKPAWKIEKTWVFHHEMQAMGIASTDWPKARASASEIRPDERQAKG